MDEGELVRLAGVRVGRGETNARPPLDLVVRRGGVTGLQGPPGSGKSFVLRLAAGLAVPSVGSVERRPVRRGYVFREGGLIENLDVATNVLLPLAYAGVDLAEAGRRVDAALARFGLDRVGRRRPAEIDPGARLFVQLARAEAFDAELLLLDEPLLTLAPDPAARVAAWVRERVAAGAGALVSSAEAWTHNALGAQVVVVAGEDSALHSLQLGGTR